MNKRLLYEVHSEEELLKKFEEIIVKNSESKRNIKEVNNLDLLTRKEVAELLKVSTVTLHHWAKKRVLIPFSIGTRVYYKKKDILESMKGGQNV